MSYRDRIRGTIVMISPKGNGFSAKWRKGEESGEKMLGIFHYPKVDGTFLQDLGITGGTQNYDLYFDGADHDLDAKAFTDALAEKGLWSVTHPVDGLLQLQPTKYKRFSDPTETEAHTIVSMEWIRGNLTSPRDEEAQTVPKLAAAIVETSDRVFGGLPDAIPDFPPAAPTKLAVNDAEAIIAPSVAMMSETDPEIGARVNASKRVIAETLNQQDINYAELTGALRARVTSPAYLSVMPLVDKLNTYTQLVNSLSSLPGRAINEATRQYVLIREAVASAAFATLAVLAVFDTLPTRGECVRQATAISDAFMGIINAFDEQQEAFSDERLDHQYFTQSQMFGDMALLAAQSAAYLLAASYELPIEKTIRIEEFRAPLEIALSEGMDFDQFIATNNLKGDSILVLSPGTEVTVYATA